MLAPVPRQLERALSPGFNSHQQEDRSQEGNLPQRHGTLVMIGVEHEIKQGTWRTWSRRVAVCVSGLCLEGHFIRLTDRLNPGTSAYLFSPDGG